MLESAKQLHAWKR